MKRYLFIILFLINFSYSFAQDNVFVLIDVSRSVTQSQLTDAKQTLTEVLSGNSLSKAFVSQGNAKDLQNFKLKPNDKVALVKFGDIQNTVNISPSLIQVQNIPGDVSQIMNSFPLAPTDARTYFTLAKAKIAEYAKNHQIAQYKLYIISDNIQDDYGTNGKPDYPDDHTRNLAEGYNTTNNPVDEAAFTKIKFSANSDFTLAFSPKVDISKYNIPNPKTPVVIDTVQSQGAVIKITSPAGGKKDNEVELKSDNLNISWTCSDCPDGGKFTVLISEYDGGKFREFKKDLSVYTISQKVPDGKFKITVSAQNFDANSDTSYAIVNTGSFAWLFALLIIGVLAGIGYISWNKKRREIVENADTQNDEIFSKSNPASYSSNTTTNTSNTDYF